MKHVVKNQLQKNWKDIRFLVTLVFKTFGYRQDKIAQMELTTDPPQTPSLLIFRTLLAFPPFVNFD